MSFEFLNPKQFWIHQSLQYEQVIFKITVQTIILKLYAFYLIFLASKIHYSAGPHGTGL